MLNELTFLAGPLAFAAVCSCLLDCDGGSSTGLEEGDAGADEVEDSADEPAAFTEQDGDLGDDSLRLPALDEADEEAGDSMIDGEEDEDV